MTDPDMVQVVGEIKRRRAFNVAQVILGGLLAATVVLVAVTVTSPAVPTSLSPARGAAAEGDEERIARVWGIRPLGVRLTAAGYMLDFRYRVLEPQKAAPILDRTIKPHLIIEDGGDRLQVPVSYKVGPMRASAKFAKADRNYFMFFANPGQRVQAGDRVTIVVGDFRLEHLTVE